MTTYVELAVNVPRVSGLFHYHLPPRLGGKVRVGHLVAAPFGKQTVQGVVMRFVERPAVPETRPILDLIDSDAVLTPAQISLAKEIAESTLSSLADCIALMLPPGLAQQVDTLYSLPDKTQDAEGLGSTQQRLVSLLARRGPLRGSQIDRALPRVNWRAGARSLARRGLLETRSVLPPPKVQPKTVRTAQLACPPEEAAEALLTLGQSVTVARMDCSPEKARERMDNLGRPGTKALKIRQCMLRFLLERSWDVEAGEIYAACGGTRADLETLQSMGLVALKEAPSEVQERRQKILDFLAQEGRPVEVAWLYAESGGNWGDLEALAERDLITLSESEVWRDPLEGFQPPPNLAPLLTGAQQEVWVELQDALRRPAGGRHPAPMLLHGVTGSGKTEVYLRAVADVLRQGKQAIVLVPEIALTPQTLRRFAGRFPGRVGVVHSGLSSGERYDTWRRARAGKVGVIVGPRSALFMPLPNLGLIILDESHDESYFQDDPPPRYHAREAALAYARLTNAVCLLGSATPDLTSTYRAQRGEWRYLHLPTRILAHREAVQAQLEMLGAEKSQEVRFRPLEQQVDYADLPPVQIVDMRRELQAGNRSIFSGALQEGLERVLERGQQAILFLNRRGQATYVFCRDCGHTMQCPRCDLPLTYHSSSEALTCHHCNYRRSMPDACPNCGSPRVKQYGTGTERVEKEVQELFPQARTLRWDYGTTRQKGAHEALLGHFAAHRADVLVGTQMLAKGLDLPLVTFVGVVLADVGLYLPDYRSSERTFQVLMQVAGRAGRSPLGGNVVLQTFTPGHYAIQAAANHDYRAYYRQEMEYRRRLGYPPFAQLVRLEHRHHRPEEAEKEARRLAQELQEYIRREDRRATQLIGPAPCFFSRIGGMYRWHIVLRGPGPVSLLRGKIFPDWRIEVNPPNLL